MRQKKLIVVTILILILALVAVGVAIKPWAEDTNSSTANSLVRESKPDFPPLTNDAKGHMLAEQLVKVPFYGYLTQFHLIADVDGDEVAVAIFDVPNHTSNSRVWAAIIADAETVSDHLAQLLPGVDLYIVSGFQITDDCEDSGCGHHDFIEVFMAYMNAETVRRGAPFPGAKLMQGEVFWDEHFFSDLGGGK